MVLSFQFCVHIKIKMQNKSKEQFTKAVQLMKEQKYKEAIDYLDVLVLKDSKNIDYNMCIGLCYQKIGNHKRCLEFYEYSYTQRPEDLKVLNSLFKFYRDDFKDLDKAQFYIEKIIKILQLKDKAKMLDMQVELCQIYNQNQERNKLEATFKEILANGSSEQIMQVAAILIPLLINLKLFDITKPNSGYIPLISQRIQNQLVSPIQVELIAQKVLDNIKSVHIIKDFAISNEHFQLLIQWLKLLPQSCLLLDEVLRYAHCYLSESQFILEQCILLLIQNEYLDMEKYSVISVYQGYQITNQEQYERTSLKAKIFISFIKHHSSQFLATSQLGACVTQMIQSKQIDQIESEQFLGLPLKVMHLYQSGRKEDITVASNYLNDFNKKVKLLQRYDLDCSLLEEVSASLSYEILVDPLALIEMKNILKVRIKNKAFAIETYTKYLQYQLKLVNLLRNYDEEIPMQFLFDKILQEEPNNLEIQIQQYWLQFSEKKLSQDQILEIYNTIVNQNLDKNIKLKIIILKRIAVLNIIKNRALAKELLITARSLVEDYEIHFQLGVISYLDCDYADSIEKLFQAFNLCQTNYHLNQTIMLILSKTNKDKALEFAVNIHKLPQFNNVFWLNFIIGTWYMQHGQFNKAHDLLEKASDQFHFNVGREYKLYYEKKTDYGDFSIPYLINQNNSVFLSDYAILSTDFFCNESMTLLTEKYFHENFLVKQFHLEVKLIEIKKLLGLYGSALKSIEKAEALVLTNEEHPLRHDDSSLQKSVYDLNQILVRGRWVCTKHYSKNQNKDIKYSRIDPRFQHEIILLNFEAAQLHLYEQREYLACERLIWALQFAVHCWSTHEQEVRLLLKAYLAVILEIGLQVMITQKSNFGTSIAIILGQKFLHIFNSISNLIGESIYSLESQREFLFYLGSINQNNHFIEQAMKINNRLLFSMCGIDINNPDQKHIFQEIRNSISEQTKKMLIVRNALHSQILSLMKLGQSPKNILQLAISLFPSQSIFYKLAYDFTQDISFLIHGLNFNANCQEILDTLGFHYLKLNNLPFAEQFFERSVQSEPTTANQAYLGLAIIGLIYLEKNYALKLPEQDLLPQQDALAIIQIQLKNKISSYINFVPQIKQSILQSILSLTYRLNHMGDTFLSEAVASELYDHPILNQYIKASAAPKDHVEEFKIYLKNMDDDTWPQQLRYILNLALQIVHHSNEFNSLMWDLMNFLKQSILKIRQATQIYNYDDLFITLINTWYLKSRDAYLNNNNLKQNYLDVLKLKDAVNELKGHKTQIINYIDPILSSRSASSQFNLKFSEQMQVGNTKQAFKILQTCIMLEPKEQTYRELLYKFKAQPQNATLSLLHYNKNQSLDYLNLVLQEVQRLRLSEDKTKRIKNIIRILKLKIIPHLTEEKRSKVAKVISDCLVYDIETESLKSLIPLNEYETRAQIQKLIHQGDISTAMQKLQQFKKEIHVEDYQNSKRAIKILLPVMCQLSLKYNIRQYMEEALQHALFAQQSLQSDMKLKSARFILNTLIYTQLLREFHSGKQIAETLIALKDCSDEYLSQGVHNPMGISLHIHYTIVSEKYDQLSEWLAHTYNYLHNHDQLIQWGLIIKSYHKATELKTIQSLKDLVRISNYQSLSIAEQALYHFLLGQAMMCITNWQQLFSKEEVLKKFQLAVLLNPSSEVSNHLRPLKSKREQKKTIKKLSEVLHDQDEVPVKPKKKYTDGLNSDSDENLVDMMDYHEDIKEFQQNHGLIANEEGVLVSYPYDQQFILQQEQANEQLAQYNQQAAYQQYYESMLAQGFTQEETEAYYTQQQYQNLIQDEQ